MTVYKNMSFGLALRKTPKLEIGRRVREAAKMLGIDALLDRKPKQLSGGERQRAAMGRAIVREPMAFLMDEPLSALDAKLRTQMRAEISKLHKKLEKTFVYVTHDQTEAMTLGTRVVVMKDGIIQQTDTPQNLYNSPVNMFVAGFIGSPQMNFFIATFNNNGLQLGKYHFALPPEILARACKHSGLNLGLRPKDIRETTDGNGVPAKVELVEQLGSETYLHLNIADSPCIASVEPDTKAKIHDVIRVEMNMSKAHLFEPNGMRI
jgi:multiple sugar transport system ATP-binding protein